MNTAEKIISEMTALKDEVQRKNLMRFFKTGKGEYGEGDEFLGLRCPQTREIVKKYYKETSLEEAETLIKNTFHEIRLCGFLMLVEKYAKIKEKNPVDKMLKRDEIIRVYLKNSEFANNWDLVDMSAPKLLGKWFLEKSMITDDEKTQIVDNLAHSKNLWQRRISMVFSWWTSRQNRPDIALKYALIHLSDKHDLMQKAVGWMLREVGKNCSYDLLREFLEDNYSRISRTSLRYAIEKFDEKERKYWLEK
ncbi:MAG: DNA alkylation repair protein [Bacteroidales bacterium]|nr:DNA alkylation repair protein [Bacteroidales bacterium]